MEKKKLTLKELLVLVIFGVILFVSKQIMEFLPNIHPVAMFIAVFTLVYRSKALISIYVYAFLIGLLNGFNLWWYPYLYIWTILWGMIMLIPKKLSPTKTVVLASIMCALHGILYGTLYAPFQALAFGLNFEGTLAWIVAGFPWDVIHMCGNIAMSFLIAPLYKVLKKLASNQASPSPLPFEKPKVKMPAKRVTLTPDFSNEQKKTYYLKK